MVTVKKGIGLIELLITSLIMSLAIGGMVSIYLLSRTAWQLGSAEVALQRKGNLAIEKMVRGAEERKGVMQAPSVTITGADSITFVDSQTPGLSREFRQEGESLYYTDVNGLEEILIEEHVRELNFSEADGLVTIELGLRQAVGDRNVDVNLCTKARLRN